MKFYSPAISILFFLTSMSTCRCSEPKLIMHVDPIVDIKSFSIKFTLSYYGSYELEVDKGSLIGQGRLKTVSLDLSEFQDYDKEVGESCKKVEEKIYIDDPSPGWRKINDGESFSEILNVGDFFKEISDVIGKCDIVINWSYKIYTKGKYRFPRISGSFTIPSDLNLPLPSDVSAYGQRWEYKK